MERGHFCNGCKSFVGDIRWHKCTRKRKTKCCGRYIKHTKSGKPYRHKCKES